MAKSNNPMVVGFAFNENRDEILLIKKTKPEWQAGRWNGIGGKAETGERRPRDTMAREFHEETGVMTDPSEWVMFAELICAQDGTRVVFFHCQLDDDRFRRAHSRTDEEVGRFMWDVVPSACLPNLRWLIPLAKYWHAQDVEGSRHSLDIVVLLEKVVKESNPPVLLKQEQD